MGKQRNIYVAGDYIASQTFGTYIAHAEHVHTQASTPAAKPAEDVEFEEVHDHFCYITQACQIANMVEHVQNHMRTACSGSADALWKCIHEYELMGYLSTEPVDASTLYDAISAYFGTLPYDKRNFRKYRYLANEHD